MKRNALVALWASLAYLVVAMTVTGWLCLSAIQVLSTESAKASGPLELISPAWVIVTANQAVLAFYWLCTSTGLGVVLIAMSAVWLSVSGRGN